MKMGSVEKRLVNSARHSRDVAGHAMRVLQGVPFSAGQTYLDVGCGNGAAALRLAEECGLSVTGVDVDPGQIRLAIEAAGARADIRFMTADATRLPFDDEAFDIVATNKAMHHVPAWELAAAEMARVLRPGGHLIFADLILPRWLAAAGQRVAPGHYGFVTRDALERALAAHDLCVVRQRFSGVTCEMVCRRAGPPGPP